MMGWRRSSGRAAAVDALTWRNRGRASGRIPNTSLVRILRRNIKALSAWAGVRLNRGLRGCGSYGCAINSADGRWVVKVSRDADGSEQRAADLIRRRQGAGDLAFQQGFAQVAKVGDVIIEDEAFTAILMERLIPYKAPDRTPKETASLVALLDRDDLSHHDQSEPASWAEPVPPQWYKTVPLPALLRTGQVTPAWIKARFQRLAGSTGTDLKLRLRPLSLGLLAAADQGVLFVDLHSGNFGWRFQAPFGPEHLHPVLLDFGHAIELKEGNGKGNQGREGRGSQTPGKPLSDQRAPDEKVLVRLQRDFTAADRRKITLGPVVVEWPGQGRPPFLATAAFLDGDIVAAYRQTMGGQVKVAPTKVWRRATIEELEAVERHRVQAREVEARWRKERDEQIKDHPWFKGRGARRNLVPPVQPERKPTLLDQTADRAFWRVKAGSKTVWLITGHDGVIDHDAPLVDHQRGNYLKKRAGVVAWAQVKQGGGGRAARVVEGIEFTKEGQDSYRGVIAGREIVAVKHRRGHYRWSIHDWPITVRYPTYLGQGTKMSEAVADAKAGAERAHPNGPWGPTWGKGRAANLGPMMEGYALFAEPQRGSYEFLSGPGWEVRLKDGKRDEDDDLELDVLQLKKRGKIVSAAAGELAPQSLVFVEHSTFTKPAHRGKGYMYELYERLLDEGFVIVSDRWNHSAPMLAVWRRIAREWVVLVPVATGGYERLTGTNPQDPLLRQRFIAFPARDVGDVYPDAILDRLGADDWYDMELVDDGERPGSRW